MARKDSLKTASWPSLADTQECATRNPSKLDLRTDAAAHYEKTLDPELCELAIARFIKLLRDEDKDITVTSAFSDVYVKKYPHITIHIDKPFIDRAIGKVLSMEEITRTLTNLKYGLKVEGDNLTIEVPTFRATKDVSQKADIIEEIARIHGYDNIVPESNLWKISPVQKDPVKTRDNLKITNGIVRLDNTLRHEMAPTMLYAIHKNLKYMNEAKVFEVGRTFDYHFDGGLAEEYKVLGIGLSSTKQTEKELMYEAKAMIDSIVSINRNMTVEYKHMDSVENNWMHPVNSYEVVVNGVALGYISVVHPKIVDAINSKAAIVVAELRMDTLGEMAKHEIEYKEISKYQTVTFDLSIIVDKDTMYGKIEEAIKEAKMEYLMNYELIDIFQNAERLLGKKAVTVRFTIGSYTDTLTKEQIDKERETVLTSLKAKGMTIAE